ncbi:MAG: hypothetical protein HUJ83_06395 [Veillonella sp.]|nr:hypothetical protein [Veillonella sp.]
MAKGWSFSRLGGFKKRADKTTRSNYESRVKKNLEKSGVDFEYESLRIPYETKHYYKPDFVLPNGVIVEAKGLFLPEDRSKHLAIQKQHPELDIRFIFMRDQYIDTKTKANKYSEWCKKNGFQYHIGEVIPKAWLTEKKRGEQD